MTGKHVLAASLVLLAATANVFGAPFGTTPALAREDASPPPPPDLYSRLMDCRTITGSAERLACFDSRSEALDTATRNREIVISDREAVKAAQRGLFGFTAPVAKLMGFGGSDAEELQELETTVIDARRTPAGWRLTFADGSTWEQNDTRDFALSPKPGNEARITRGALGTYLVSVKGQRSLKMRRVE